MKGAMRVGKVEMSTVDQHMLDRMKKSDKYIVIGYARDMFDKKLIHVMWREVKGSGRKRRSTD